MNRATNKIFALFLSVSLLLGSVLLFPLPVAAANYTVDLGGFTVTSDTVDVTNTANIELYYNGTKVIIKTSGDYTFSMKQGGSSPTDEGVEIETGLTVNLTLNSIRSSHSIWINSGATVNLYLEGTNEVSCNDNGKSSVLGVAPNSNLNVYGPGSLVCYNKYGSAIVLFANVTVTLLSGSVQAEGGTLEDTNMGYYNGEAGVYLSSTAILRVEGGELTAVGGPGKSGTSEPGGAGIGGVNNRAGGTVIINGGKVTATGGPGGTFGGLPGYDIGASGSGTDGGSLTLNDGELHLTRYGAGPLGNMAVNLNGGTLTDASGRLPVISQAAPDSGPVTGGTQVVLTGTGFTDMTSATVGGVPATAFHVDNPTQITLTTPAGTVGTADLILSDGIRTSLPYAFIYTDTNAPVIAAQGGGTEIPHGGSLTLEVTNAGAYSTPAYQWYKDSVALTGETANTLTATEAGSYKAEVTDQGQTKESNVITLTEEGAPPPPVTDNPSATAAGSLSLDLNGTRTGTIRISLGMSGSSTMAARAEATSDNPAVATATPTQVNGNGDVTVEAMAVGNANITVTFYDSQGNMMSGDFGGPFAVNVVNSYSPPISSSRDRSSDSDSGSTSRTWTPLVTAPTTHTIDAAEMRRLIAAADKNGWDFARSSNAPPTTIKAEAWKLLTGKKFVARTTVDKVVEVQLTFPEPTKITTDMQVSGYTKGSIVDSRRALFEKWYSNKLRIVHLEHTSSFGQAVEIAAKVDLTGMDSDNLYIYRYDKETNSYTLICKPGQTPAEYWIDGNGYLHFYTDKGGDFAVCDGPLARK